MSARRRAASPGDAGQASLFGAEEGGPPPMPGGEVPGAGRLNRPLVAHLAEVPPAWRALLGEAWGDAAVAAVFAAVDARVRAGATVYPERPFRALDRIAPDAVRVVILGQDPYHGPGQAQGLAFSVPRSCRRPPSLRNIFLEAAAASGGDPLSFGNDLSAWAAQGVLLLNAVLTVEAGQAASHAKLGWEALTDALLAALSRLPGRRAYLLWGAYAQSKRDLLAPRDDALVLQANHPSPLSARRPPVPFVGCGHFAQVNAWFQAHGEPPIDWRA